MLKTEPSKEDIAWARKYGWIWDGEAFFPEPFIRVIPNPMNDRPGWCPWLSPIGALQTDAPFSCARAALRAAESIRQQRHLNSDEMSCAED